MKKFNFIIVSITLVLSICLISCNWESINNYLFTQNHIYEFLGVCFSIIYVILSIKQNIFCWPALIIAAILNGYAFYLIGLPLQSIMQLFFISVAISGWRNWKKKEANQFLVKKWPLKKVSFWIFIGLLLTFVLALILLKLERIQTFLLLHFGPFVDSLNNALEYEWIVIDLKSFKSKFPFFDALMFMFNVIPMYMTTKKVIQSWLIFIVIDIISGFFYLYTGDYFYCFLFFFYIPFATYGYLNWKKHLN